MLYAVGERENSSDALGHSGYVNAILLRALGIRVPIYFKQGLV
jgi:hypothetical protein